MDLRKDVGDAAPAESPAPALGKFDATVERWIAQHLNGSVVSRDTEAWNYLRGKLGALKTMLEEEHGR